MTIGVTITAQVMMGSIKLVLGDPRPYWVSTEIHMAHCSASFGNPSGHTLMSFSPCIFLWLQYRDTFKVMWQKILFCAVCLTLPSMTAYSRVLLGYHSVDQILYGFSLAVWNACTWFYIMGLVLPPHVLRFYNSKWQLTTKNTFKYFVWNMIIMVILVYI
jgi:membrane-associated phospholipid phosphatase